MPALFVNNNYKSQSARFLGILFKIFFVSLVLQIFLLPLTLKIFGTVGLWFPLNVFWLPLLGFVVLPFSFITLLLLALPFDCAHDLAGYCLEIAGFPVSWLLDILDWLHSGQFLSEPVFLRPHWTALFAYAMIFAAFAFLAKLWKQNCRERKELNPVRFSRHSLYALIFSKKRNSPSSALAVSSPRGRNETATITFLCLGLVFLAIGPLLRLERYFASDPVLEVLDVGQGQAILLHFGRHGKILVDGGGMSSERFEPGKAILTPILTDNHAPYLTAIINSHPDLDHLGGLIYPIKHLNFQKQFHNGYAANGVLHDKWESLKNKPNSFVLRAGDTVRMAGSGYYLEALAPLSDTYPLSANNASLVLRLTDGKKGLALIPGDAEKGSIKKLLDSEKYLSAQILIAPHHGSNSSFSAKFLDKVNPELVVAACGFRNRYFYPGRKLREWTRKNGVKLLDTGESGRLGIRWDKNGKFRVEQVFRD